VVGHLVVYDIFRWPDTDPNADPNADNDARDSASRSGLVIATERRREPVDETDVYLVVGGGGELLPDYGGAQCGSAPNEPGRQYLHELRDQRYDHESVLHPSFRSRRLDDLLLGGAREELVR
jgi:hypothetical protein